LTITDVSMFGITPALFLNISFWWLRRRDDSHTHICLIPYPSYY
jgi:hypothetical protein